MVLPKRYEARCSGSGSWRDLAQLPWCYYIECGGYATVSDADGGEGTSIPLSICPEI